MSVVLFMCVVCCDFAYYNLFLFFSLFLQIFGVELILSQLILPCFPSNLSYTLMFERFPENNFVLSRRIIMMFRTLISETYKAKNWSENDECTHRHRT